MKKRRNPRGFTLIELLIVIAIVGILTALLTANFIGARQRARDTRRKSDLKQIQTALEFYRADNGQYPTDTTLVECGATLSSTVGATENVYMQAIPCDPSFGNGEDGYQYATTDGSTYSIRACLENVSDQDRDGGATSTDNGTADTCPVDGLVSFTVSSP